MSNHEWNGILLHPFLRAAQKGDIGQMMQRLSGGADVNMKTPGGAHALDLALRDGHVDAAGVLVTAGADISGRVAHYASILHAACDLRSPELLVRALRRDDPPPLDLQDKAGRTALMIALDLEDAFAAGRLLEAGADARQLRDKQGRTAADRLADLPEAEAGSLRPLVDGGAPKAASRRFPIPTLHPPRG